MGVGARAAPAVDLCLWFTHGFNTIPRKHPAQGLNCTKTSNLNHILKNPKVNQETVMALNSEDNINKSPDIGNKVPLHHWPQRLMSQGLENNYPVKLVMMEHSWKGTGLWWPRCFQVNEMCWPRQANDLENVSWQHWTEKLWIACKIEPGFVYKGRWAWWESAPWKLCLSVDQKHVQLDRDSTRRDFS